MRALKRFGALSLAILMLSTSGGTIYAQDADWDTRLTTALEAPYPNDQIVALEALFESEAKEENKLAAAYWVAVIAKDLKRLSLAADYGEKALNLADTYAADDLQLRDAIVAQLVEIYFLDEKSGKAIDTIDANLALNDAMMDDIWAETTDGIVHRYSGLNCPNRIGNLYREKAYNFHPTGIDVGCGYKEYNGEDNAVTLYLTKQSDDGDSRTPHEKAMAAVYMNWGDADVLTDSKLLAKKSGAGTDVTHSLLRLGSIQKGYRYTGTWTSDVAGWTLKSRITWDGALKQDFGEKHVKALLGSPTKSVGKRLRRCDKDYSKTYTSEKLKNDGVVALTALSLLGRASLVSERPDEACLSEVSIEGNVIVESYEEKTRKYSLVGDAIEGDIYLHSLPLSAIGLSKSRHNYVFRQDIEDKEGNIKTRVLAMYDGIPSPKTLLTDFVGIYNGNEKIIGSITNDGEGNITLNIVPVDSDED